MNYFFLLILATFWGGSFVAIKIVLGQNIPPVFSAFIRVALSLVFVRIFLLILKKPTYTPPDLRWRSYFSGLFTQGLPFGFLFWGERFVSPGLAGILNGTQPIWTFLFVLTTMQKEEFSPRKMVGLFLGISGLIVIFYPLLSFESSYEQTVGTVAITMMAICYAIGTIMNKKLLTGSRPIDFHANIYNHHVASVVLLFTISLIFEKWPTDYKVFLQLPVATSFLYMSFFSTAIAWFLYFHLVKTWGAIRASTVTYLVPIMALVWDYVFFHHTPALNQLQGICLILVGVFLIQFQFKKKILTTS